MERCRDCTLRGAETRCSVGKESRGTTALFNNPPSVEGAVRAPKDGREKECEKDKCIPASILATA